MNRVYQSGNVELREEDNGDVVLENTATNETVTLSGSFEEVVAAVNNHTENDVHTQNQPNQSHDNEDHDRDFVDETEAANAAPTQSVFGRVGDVVAEANDYAATQIQNFGSEVISTIDGSSISPSDIPNLWDGQNVTADVDNESVSTASASVTDAPTEDTDVVRKTENDEKVDQTAFDSHATRHEQGGADELAVDGLSGDLAEPQDPKTHNDAHGYQGNDELATALKYDPIAEPETPTEGCVRWFDNTENAYKVKFDDGTAITVGEK